VGGINATLANEAGGEVARDSGAAEVVLHHANPYLLMTAIHSLPPVKWQRLFSRVLWVRVVCVTPYSCACSNFLIGVKRQKT
jgi:hypothetical protein